MYDVSGFFLFSLPALNRFLGLSVTYLGHFACFHSYMYAICIFVLVSSGFFRTTACLSFYYLEKMDRKRNFRTYSTEEALEKIFEPGSDSEMSGLEDEDTTDLIETENVVIVQERIRDECEDEEIFRDESYDEDEDVSFRISRLTTSSLALRMSQENEPQGNVDSPTLPADLQLASIQSFDDGKEISPIASADAPVNKKISNDPEWQSSGGPPIENEITNDELESSSDEAPDEDDQENIQFDLAKYSDHNYRWRSVVPPVKDTSFSGPEIPLPPENFDQLTPLNYFQMFWGPDLDQLIAEQTNLYSTQLTTKSIGVTAHEIRKLIGIQMLMAVVKLPQYEMYWAKETRYPPVAEAMSIKRYKELRRFLHVSDNSKKDQPENKDNKLYKIEPVLIHSCPK